MKRIGFLVNPIAGIGGRVGLKGSDGEEIQEKAQKLGAKPEAGKRALQTMKYVEEQNLDLHILAAPGVMGADILKEMKLDFEVIDGLSGKVTTAEDTIRIAKTMAEKKVDLIVFAGGDGTARNVCEAIGMEIPVLGIPAGVKIHSAVYAYNPKNAGEALRTFCSEFQDRFEEAEVMDIDEDAFRTGVVQAKLYGYMKIPVLHRYMQSVKSGGYSEKENTMGIALEVISRMNPDTCYIVGPGTTTRAIMDALGLPNTLLGMDVVKGGKVLKADANENDIFELASKERVVLILTVIGGQGHLFGRGNQQISPRILRKIARDDRIVVATKSKLLSIPSFKLIVDTGDDDLNRELAGYIKVITGYQESMVCKIE